MFALLLLLSAPPLLVRVEPPDEACQFLVRVPAALARLAPELKIHTGQGPADLQVVLQVEGPSLFLTLRDPAGPGIFRRELPNPREACLATADGVGLIVERHLRGLGLLPPEPPPALEPPPAPEALPSPEPPAPPLSVSSVTSSTASWGAPNLWLGLAAQLQIPTAAGLRLGVGGDLRFQLGPLAMAAGISLFAPQEVEVLRRGRPLGNFRLQSWWVRGGLGACFRLAGASCAMALVGVERAAARVSGNLFQQVEDSQVRVAYGLSLQQDLLLGGPVGLRAEASAWLRPSPPRFVVDGADNALEEPGFTLIFGVGGALQIL
ncbi:MAG: hypothetical protein IPG45_03120 [Deltaproteobacteria bacterium]|nr:hypothetical protein [Deltaproteobacteria bacterium]